MGSRTFNYSGEWEKWNVPAGVKLVDVTVRGAGSGSRKGGYVTGRLKVDPTDVLWIMVGKQGNLHNGTKPGDRTFGGGGAGGAGANGKAGGNSGGGASAIRKNAKDGKILAVAGGAGGDSGDTGAGGKGGASIGEHGSAGTGTGGGATYNSTGGTQNQTGKGGTSVAAEKFWGGDGTGGSLGRGGAGADSGAGDAAGHGGGGGGGGYYPGGGGQAARIGVAAGGGGAGGSNYIDPLFNTTNVQGGGTVNNGQVTLTWEDPGGDTPPTPPENITINGQAIADGLATKATDSVIVRGTPDDPDSADHVRMVIYKSRSSEFANYSVHRGTYDATEHRDKVTIGNLDQDTRYYLRLYTEDANKKLSLNYRSTNFWTNRKPNPPELLSPGENVMFSADLNVTFTWNHSDPDPSDAQKGWELRYRRAATPIDSAGEWISTDKHLNDSTEMWVIDAGTFKTNVFYEWTVRTQDSQDRWGEWANPKSFYIQGEATPPVLLEPLGFTAVVAAQVKRFMWKFLAPNSGVTQNHADLRYRVRGTSTWITLTGDSFVPGSDWFWDVPAETFEAGFTYEWQVRSTSSDSLVSDWSDSGFFRAVVAPGSSAGAVIVESGKPQSPLGIGNNEAFIYDRGGEVLRGQIKPMVDIKWGRTRDDISTCLIHVDSWDEKQAELYRSMHTWTHEIVVFRDGVRVWEGPITRITSRKGALEIEARDVMAYVYRRIMRQGYNDAYRIINGTQVGLHTVIERSQQIIMNALAYDDPNILGYLTPFITQFDARTSRVRPDYSMTAWEEIDDLAAHAGLDYGTSGRRIMLWDTHNPVGRLPEMRDRDFSDDPVITEYGMSAANYQAVTDSNGIWGGVTPAGIDPANLPGPTGWIELLASSYGEAEAPESQQTLTKEGRKQMENAMREQARRNISGRWPIPLMVRVPDNSSLNPNINLGINQLVPGVWVPLRADTGIQSVSQWQKLDSMTVVQDKDGEKITVVMSPAPNRGQDPDADSSQGEEV